MRISYVFMVAAATTLLVSGTAATASDRSTEVSTLESPDAVASISTGQATGGEKRFLRYHRNEDHDDDEKEDVEDSDDEEERAEGANLFELSKVDEADTTIYRSVREKLFRRWKKYGYTPYNLKNREGLQSYGDLLEKFRMWRYHGGGQR